MAKFRMIDLMTISLKCPEYTLDIDEDEEIGPIPVTTLLLILHKLYLSHQKHLPDCFELDYEGASDYKMTWRQNNKYEVAHFTIRDKPSHFLVTLKSEFEIVVKVTFGPLGISRQYGPEGFRNPEDYGYEFKEDLQSWIDNDGYFTFVMPKPLQ